MQARTPLWRKTPLAVFPVTLGFVGLGMAWRNGAKLELVPAAIGELLLGLASALFIFMALSYLAKVIARPGVVMEDIKTPPARAGLSAITMTLMIMAAVLLPYSGAALYVWWLGVVLHVVVILLVSRSILNSPPEGRSFSPFQLLPYVGLIVAPMAGVPLGFEMISMGLAAFSLATFAVILLGYLAKLWRVRPQHPLRPSVMIFLAPFSLFAMTADQFGYAQAFDGFYWVAVALAFILMSLMLWLTTGGWTPIWGSFTFPLAIFTSLQTVVIADDPMNILAEFFYFGGLVTATSMIFYILYKTMRAWLSGGLSKNTAAATA